MKILITGGNGYLAKSITKSLWSKYHIIAPGKDELDLTNSKSVDRFFKDKHFDVVIHTAIKGAATPRDPDETISFWNLVMFYNLISKKDHFNKLINIGSGAERYLLNTPYGHSKSIINKLVHKYDNFYTLRVYGVFSEDELETRFIKASISNVLQGNPIKIHQDKLMDFMYMPDLIAMMEHYIVGTDLTKEVDCIYEDTVSLSKIAKYINNHLSVNKVPINIEDPLPGENYIGTYTELPIAYVGLEQGITNVYNKLANAAN
jgi:dTDP-4-dehydrorhamnose reductase